LGKESEIILETGIILQYFTQQVYDLTYFSYPVYLHIKLTSLILKQIVDLSSL